MQNIIRLGDKLSSGGEVLTANSGMTFMGRVAACVGDIVACPLPGHGRNQIVEGDPAFLACGRPVALHGHQCACGCVLINSLPEAGRA